jgi:hypothetical protein
VTVLRIGDVSGIGRRISQRERGVQQGKRERCAHERTDLHGRLLKNFYCALVAVTTATEVGVATPVMGGGVTGGGVFPDGGGVDALELLPPQPLLNVTKAMSIIATRSSRP